MGPILSLPIMRGLTIPIILGLLAITCHAAPSSVPLKTRQVTTLSLTFFGAGPNPPSYEVDVPIESEENFQSFNISESLHHPHAARVVGFLFLLFRLFHTCISP